MSYEEIIGERNGFRVKLVVDDDAQEPYDDGSSPLMRYVTGTYYSQVEQVTGITSYVLPNSIERAAQQLDRETFERYLRIFHDVTTVEWYHGGDDLFVTFDNVEWREAMGITDDLVAGHKYADLSDWKAYCEGNVYGVIVEVREPRKATREQLDAAFEAMRPGATYRDVTRAADNELEAEDDPFVWSEVDAVWGHYGDTYATEVARERLADYADEEKSA